MADEQRYVLHTWTKQSEWSAPTIIGGDGAWFWDEHGRRYLDLSSQAECCNLGHQHPAVVRAIQAQAGRLCYISNAWGAQPRAELAQRIVRLANSVCPAQSPIYGRVFFTCDGAEATEHAIKIARWVTGRRKIVARYRSYHGATHGALSLSGDARGRQVSDGLRDVVRVLPPYCYRCPFGLRYPTCTLRCADHVADVIAYEGPQTIAAVIAEPAAGTNGIAAPPEYWPRLRQICDQHNILLIADEVMSGFGRCGAWFAWQAQGLTEAGHPACPDLFLMAKGLTGAHIPLGAICVSERVAAYFDAHTLETGLTYSGHPLACAAGVAALRAYEEEGLIERAAQLGAWMFERLHAIQRHHACIGDVRGMGLFACIEMSENTFPEPLPWLKRLARTALQHGVSVAVRSNLLFICPPLVIEQPDLDWGLSVIDKLLPA
ncbi:MAG: aminotransferase class III-fold pyridoxal phosphate-dependent enzyme [Anaerolineae bacterium]|nr:aminotransferase class III-fold pyridoxal phosphate-dependent enzyme [Thermoflexales bacterium]MDW8406812.1 aminotransferase class III-fold pyridoxal phosphate-dependent enzyme [Anaerolineae bacterium]